MVICLERGADLHMAQLIPLPLTVSCFSKIEIGLPFWYRLTRVVPDKEPLCVCVCVRDYYSIQLKKPTYKKRCYSDMQSKKYMSQINLQHRTTTNSGEQEDYKVKTDMLKSIGKQSGESRESVWK